MGGKRYSPEEVVISFFQNADPAVVASIGKIVAGIVKARCPKVPKTGTKRKVKQPDSRQATIPAAAPKEDLPF
jgi:hypothetical protein